MIVSTTNKETNHHDSAIIVSILLSPCNKERAFSYFFGKNFEFTPENHPFLGDVVVLKFTKITRPLRNNYIYYKITAEDEGFTEPACLGEIGWDNYIKEYFVDTDEVDRYMTTSEMRQVVEFMEGLPVQN